MLSRARINVMRPILILFLIAASLARAHNTAMRHLLRAIQQMVARPLLL